MSTLLRLAHALLAAATAGTADLPSECLSLSGRHRRSNHGQRARLRARGRAGAPQVAAELHFGYFFSCLQWLAGPFVQRRPRVVLGARVPQGRLHGAARSDAAPPRSCRLLAETSWMACAALGAWAPRLHLVKVGYPFAIASSILLELVLSCIRMPLMLGGWSRSVPPRGETLGSFTHARATAPRRLVVPPAIGFPAMSSPMSAASALPRQGR